MAVPKKKMGKCAQGHRRSKWKAILSTTATCKNCNETKLTHTVCGACGFYGDKLASKKAVSVE